MCWVENYTGFMKSWKVRSEISTSYGKILPVNAACIICLKANINNKGRCLFINKMLHLPVGNHAPGDLCHYIAVKEGG